jgi:Region found in RelA / SpoT proteins
MMLCYAYSAAVTQPLALVVPALCSAHCSAYCSADAGLVWGDAESPTSSTYSSSSSSSDDSSSSSSSSYAAAQHDKELCYRVLEAVHAVLQPVSPPRVKDYIAFPKSNGYTSLHTTVFLLGYPVEVQVTEHVQLDNFNLL